MHQSGLMHHLSNIHKVQDTCTIHSALLTELTKECISVQADER